MASSGRSYKGIAKLKASPGRSQTMRGRRGIIGVAKCVAGALSAGAPDEVLASLICL